MAEVEKKVLFFLLPLVMVLSSGFGTASDRVFVKAERFPYAEKFPSGFITCVYSDKDGYMWFGTRDGVCRFDGNDVKVFRSSAKVPDLLTDNSVLSIVEDHHRRIWVGTYEGISIIDKQKCTVEHFDLPAINNRRINCLLEDSKGFIWVGTSDYGVLRVNPDTKEFDRYWSGKESPLRLKGNSVSAMHEDCMGNIWLLMWKCGMCRIDPVKKQLYRAPKIGGNNNPYRIYEDKEGVCWVATWGDGLYAFRPEETPFKGWEPLRVTPQPEKPIGGVVFSITGDDKYGLVWVVSSNGLHMVKRESDGTATVTDGGAFIGDGVNHKFQHIGKDYQGNLWVCSNGDEVVKLGFNRPPVTAVTMDAVKQYFSTQVHVTRICELAPDDVCFTLAGLGLFRYNPVTGTVERNRDEKVGGWLNINALIYLERSREVWLVNEVGDVVHILKKDATSTLRETGSFLLRREGVSARGHVTYTMFEDAAGTVWFGTNNGLFRKDSGAGVSFVTDEFKFVNDIAQDVRGNIWLGTDDKGALVLPVERRNAPLGTGFANVALGVGTYQCSSVHSICCSKTGAVYIGTKEGCLFEYAPNGMMTELSGLYGITDEGICDIREDASAMLWISTTKRIVRYNPKSHSSSYYSNKDEATMSSMFFKNAGAKLNGGQVLFGGNKGFCVFDPSDLKLMVDTVGQRVYITDMTVQNRSVFDDGNEKHFDASTNRITLQDSESNLGIEYSALNFSSANRIQYAYMLTGIDEGWIYAGDNHRSANYSNLPPGKYLFNVKATGADGAWGKGVTSLEIVVLPPLYKTWWAYLLYLVAIATVAVTGIRMWMARMRAKNELHIIRIEKDKAEELSQTKLRYFTNISHELLTPLTIIMLLAEKMEKGDGQSSSQVEVLRANADRLKRLIQQILAFRKSESGNERLRLRQVDVVALVADVCRAGFRPLVLDKGINFTLETGCESYLAWIDADKVDKVLYNLLSNAFKYTPAGGDVGVKMDFVERDGVTVMRLSVSDSGAGIAENEQALIFQRFYTGRRSDPGQSNGIGLSLTHDLLRIHKGKIEVKSQLGSGTVFTVEIPVSRNAYTDEEICHEAGVVRDDGSTVVADVIGVDGADGKVDAPGDFTVLVVEDNHELRALMVAQFATMCRVVEAENGQKALAVLADSDIDLVVSDVMMPEMDGLTLCRRLKNNVATSHIAVLMITARDSADDRIECYNAGADAYISKPFEMRLLVARARNLMGKRQQKSESFQGKKEVNISQMEYGSIDEAFLKKAVSCVEENLSDVTLGFDQLAVAVGTSKTTLHRKLKSLTGLSPGEFIRNIRLKHAALMFDNRAGNISQIAYSVGFNDPKYFARCFKSEFGVSPSDYQNRDKAEG